MKGGRDLYSRQLQFWQLCMCICASLAVIGALLAVMGYAIALARVESLEVFITHVLRGTHK